MASTKMSVGTGGMHRRAQPYWVRREFLSGLLAWCRVWKLSVLEENSIVYLPLRPSDRPSFPPPPQLTPGQLPLSIIIVPYSFLLSLCVVDMANVRNKGRRRQHPTGCAGVGTSMCVCVCALACE